MTPTTPSLQHPFPTIRIGALWFAFIGLVLLLSTLLAPNHVMNGPLFFLGFVAGVAGILLNRRLRARLAYGQPSKHQRTAMFLGLGLQTLLFIILFNGFRSVDARTFWLLALIVVGLHLLPFGLVHGPKSAVLGGLCLASAGIGLLCPTVPFLVFGVVDALLKIAFGVWMFTAQS